MIYQFWLPFVLLLALVIYLDRNYSLLRDISVLTKKPFSWSRVQLAWWTVIILSSVIAIVWHDMQTAPPANIPNLHYSTLVLLGISAGTTAVARMIDVSDINDSNPTLRHQDMTAQPGNLILDILSDENGVSIHRLQAVIFNLVFGIWFISIVLFNLAPGHDPCSLYTNAADTLKACTGHELDYIMPVISDNNLILLGLSSATYAAIKTSENKAPVASNIVPVKPVNPVNPSTPGNPAVPVNPVVPTSSSNATPLNSGAPINQ